MLSNKNFSFQAGCRLLNYAFPLLQFWFVTRSVHEVKVTLNLPFGIAWCKVFEGEYIVGHSESRCDRVLKAIMGKPRNYNYDSSTAGCQLCCWLTRNYYHFLITLYETKAYFPSSPCNKSMLSHLVTKY